MQSWARLVLQFASDGVIDIQDIHTRLCQFYDIGYTGLYDCGGHMSLYIQTASKQVRMTPGKLMKICKEFGPIASPVHFNNRNGTLIEEVGSFRNRGPAKRWKTPSGKTPVSNNNTVNNTVNNNDHSTTINNDHSVNTTNNDNTIHLHIHAFGEEDVSHITMDQFKSLIGTKKEVMDMVRQYYTPNAYNNITEVAWHDMRRTLAHALYLKEQDDRYYAELAAAAPAPSDAAPDAAADATPHAEAAKGAEPSEVSSDIPSDAAPDAGADEQAAKGAELSEVSSETSDDLPDSDYLLNVKDFDMNELSEHTQKLKALFFEKAVLDEHARSAACSLPFQLAELMYENPHNANVIHATKNGRIKYFDGASWVEILVSTIGDVVRCSTKLGEKSQGDTRHA